MTKKVPLRVFKNEILFQFEDGDAVMSDGKTKQRGFEEKTSWGLVFVSPTQSASAPRWGTVVGIGPDVTDDIFIGRRILIENLKWTEAMEYAKQKFWKTNEAQVIAVDNREDR